MKDQASARLIRPWGSAFALLGIFVLALLLRYPIADIPLDRDEGEYAYIGQRWLLGEVPYRDSFDQKPPAVFVLYALLQVCAGTSPAALHWGAQLYTLGTLALVFLLGRKLFSPRAGLFAAALCAFLTSEPSVFGNSANTETFMILPLAGALLATLRAQESGSIGWALGAGALSGAALLCKQVALANAVFCLLLLLLAPRRALLAAALLAGMAAVLLPVCAYFLAAGAWDEFYDCVIGFNLRYANLMTIAEYPEAFGRTFGVILASCWPVYLLALAGLLLGLFGRGSAAGPATRAGTLVLAAWLLVCGAGTAAGGFFRNHYFLQVVPGVALLAGLALAALPRLLGPGPFGKALPWALVAFCLLYGVLQAPVYYLVGSPQQKCQQLYDISSFPQSGDVAAFLDGRSDPSDTVFILGSEPQILYYARRKSASRCYIFTYPLMLGPVEETRRRQEEVIAELDRAEPRFLITVFPATSTGLNPDSPWDLIDAVRQRLQRSYRFAAAIAFDEQGQTHFATGREVEEFWQAHPMWYDRDYYWGTLAVWERVQEPPR